MSQNGTKRHILLLDLQNLRENPKYNDLVLTVLESDDGQEYWRIKLRGSNYYQGNVYDMEIHFSRRHPFEAPMILFPMTNINQQNVKHPKMDSYGRLQASIVSLDNWTPITTVSDIVDEARMLFAEDPPHSQYMNDSSILDLLSTEILQKVSFFLSLRDICKLSETSRKHLAILHSDEFWAMLYYQRCDLSNSLIYQMSRPGPLRVLTQTGHWHWQDARESFIQAHECGKYATSVPPMEDLAANELRLMTMVSNPNFFWWQNASSPSGSPRAELLQLWGYRLQRSARVSRWLCGDAHVRRMLSVPTPTLSASTMQFLAALIVNGNMSIEDCTWFQRAASFNDQYLRTNIVVMESELSELRADLVRLRETLCGAASSADDFPVLPTALEASMHQSPVEPASSSSASAVDETRRADIDSHIHGVRTPNGVNSELFSGQRTNSAIDENSFTIRQQVSSANASSAAAAFAPPRLRPSRGARGLPDLLHDDLGMGLGSGSELYHRSGRQVGSFMDDDSGDDDSDAHDTARGRLAMIVSRHGADPRFDVSSRLTRGMVRGSSQELPHPYAYLGLSVPNQECLICYTRFDDGAMLITLPCRSNHTFHSECLQREVMLDWHGPCPACGKSDESSRPAGNPNPNPCGGFRGRVRSFLPDPPFRRGLGVGLGHPDLDLGDDSGHRPLTAVELVPPSSRRSSRLDREVAELEAGHSLRRSLVSANIQFRNTMRDRMRSRLNDRAPPSISRIVRPAPDAELWRIVSRESENSRLYDTSELDGSHRCGSEDTGIISHVDASDAAQPAGLVFRGPDVFDLLETMHEAEVALAYWFRDFAPNQVTDLRDAEGNWLSSLITGTRHELGASRAVDPIPALLAPSPLTNPFVTPGVSEYGALLSKFQQTLASLGDVISALTHILEEAACDEIGVDTAAVGTLDRVRAHYRAASVLAHYRGCCAMAAVNISRANFPPDSDACQSVGANDAVANPNPNRMNLSSTPETMSQETARSPQEDDEGPVRAFETRSNIPAPADTRFGAKVDAIMFNHPAHRLSDSLARFYREMVLEETATTEIAVQRERAWRHGAYRGVPEPFLGNPNLHPNPNRNSVPEPFLETEEHSREAASAVAAFAGNGAATAIAIPNEFTIVDFHRPVISPWPFGIQPSGFSLAPNPDEFEPANATALASDQGMASLINFDTAAGQPSPSTLSTHIPNLVRGTTGASSSGVIFDHGPLPFGRHFLHRRRLSMHYIGHETRFDEDIPAHSPRVALYRTHTRRLPSAPMMHVQNIISQTGLQTVAWGPCPKSIMLKVRCLWLASTKGAGIVSMLVPPTLPLHTVLTDYEQVFSLDAGKKEIARINMAQATRYSLSRRLSVAQDRRMAGLGLAAILSAASMVNEQSRLNKGLDASAASKSAKCELGQDDHSIPGVSIFRPSMTIADAGFNDGDVIDILLDPYYSVSQTTSTSRRGRG